MQLAGVPDRPLPVGQDVQAVTAVVQPLQLRAMSHAEI